MSGAEGFDTKIEYEDSESDFDDLEGVDSDPRSESTGHKKEASDLIKDDYSDFHEGIIKNSEIVKEYDVNEYSKIQILHNPYINEKLYRIVEPELTELEEKLRLRVSKDIEADFENIPIENMSPEEVEDRVRSIARDHLERQKTLIGRVGNKSVDYINSAIERFPSDYSDKKIDRKFETVTEENIENVLYYLVRDFAKYEKLSSVMDDGKIEDISCNAPNTPVFLYHKDYQDVITNVMYEKDELDEFVASLAQMSGKNISIADPNMQGRLPDGSRMQLTYSEEISDGGSNYTIRKFQEEPFTPVELVEFGTFTLKQMSYLWLAIENDMSLIFAGGTASGKTTSMNAISLFIPPRSKIVSIEDTREITLSHSNWVKSVTRDSFGGGGETGKVGMYQLLRDALRQRPEYIIVGEIRGEEAQTLFQAMSTGHTTYSTMHAEDVGSAVRRLENEPIELPRQMLESLDILSIQLRIVDNEGNVLRRCREMVEIIEVDSETQSVKTRTIFNYNPQDDNIEFEGSSKVLEDIKRMKNWSQEDLEAEMNRRQKVLRYLIEETDTRDYEIISGILRTYMQNKESIMNKIDSNDLLTNYEP